MSNTMYDADNFEEFWEHYQDLHASPSVRVAHAVGTSSALLLLVRGALRRSPLTMLAAPVVDYVIAQASHRLEGEKTQPLRRPLWHARAELRLFRSTLRSIVRGRRGRRELPADEQLPPPA